MGWYHELDTARPHAGGRFFVAIRPAAQVSRSERLSAAGGDDEHSNRDRDPNPTTIDFGPFQGPFHLLEKRLEALGVSA